MLTVEISSNCISTASVTLHTISDENHMITDPAYTVPLPFTATPTECGAEVILSETISPPATISTPIDNTAGLIQIPLITDLAKAQSYTISVTAKIGTTDFDTKSFTLKVYDCSSLTIDPAKFPDPATPYTIGETQQNIDW